MTARTAVAVIAGTVGWYLHLQCVPWSIPDTDSIPDNPASFRQG